MCGGFHGPAESYADVTFDLTAQEPLVACVAAQVMVDPETPVGLLGGYDCSWDIACFSGQGALYAADFFGLRFVYVVGSFGTVVAGKHGVDLPG